jgi:hypothetical protein
VKLSTLESEAYNQAMFVCKEVKVEERDKLRVRCQMERGLLSSHSCHKESFREYFALLEIANLW